MRGPMAIPEYAQYCAPTTLAYLFDCPREEAAEYLTAMGSNCGDGSTSNWDSILKDLGGVDTPVVDPDGAERMRRARNAYYEGERRTWPSFTLGLPTVAQFLRTKPLGLYVLWTTTHTLVARDGVVVCDTLSTKSTRARVRAAYRFPELENTDA